MPVKKIFYKINSLNIDISSVPQISKMFYVCLTLGSIAEIKKSSIKLIGVGNHDGGK